MEADKILFNIKKVVYNEPKATIVYWTDGTKTVVKCKEGDNYSKEGGLALCVMKKLCGDDSEIFHAFFKDDFTEGKCRALTSITMKRIYIEKFCNRIATDDYSCEDCPLFKPYPENCFTDVQLNVIVENYYKVKKWEEEHGSKKSSN